MTDDGPLRIDAPRVRTVSFEPLLIPKNQRRFTGFDDKIVAMYASGMTVCEIEGFQVDQYGTEVSPEFISSVTEVVVRNKAIYLALGIQRDDTRDILGLWIENTEGAQFWMKVFNDLKTGGVNDILIAVTDGLKGKAEALWVVFPVKSPMANHPPNPIQEPKNATKSTWRKKSRAS